MCTIRAGVRNAASAWLAWVLFATACTSARQVPKPVVSGAAAMPRGSAAAPNATYTPSSGPAPQRGEAEFLIAPGGGVIDVPVHISAICVFSFPEKLVPQGIVSSPDFEVQTWGAENVAVRALAGATTATVALTTTSGNVKINATLRVVPEDEPALTLVRLVPASEEEAFQARVATEVERKLAPMRASLAALAREQDAQARELAEQAITAGVMRRSAVTKEHARERNRTHAIVYVPKAVVLGETVYVVFEVENRGKAPFRLASVQLRGRRGVELPASLYLSAAPDPGANAVAVVAASAKVRGVVAVPLAELSREDTFSLQVAEVDPQRSISIGDLTL